jgi:hypothetical protein
MTILYAKSRMFAWLKVVMYWFLLIDEFLCNFV